MYLTSCIDHVDELLAQLKQVYRFCKQLLYASARLVLFSEAMSRSLKDLYDKHVQVDEAIQVKYNTKMVR